MAAPPLITFVIRAVRRLGLLGVERALGPPRTTTGHRGRIVPLAAALTPALVAAFALALAAPGATWAADPVGTAADTVSLQTDGADSFEPVPTLDPEWSDNFVPPPMPRARAAATLCRPLDAVFYAPTDWLRLAQKLRGDPSACAQYYISVPPLAADKTRLRSGEAARIRALGPQMHAMAEINVTGWTNWVAAGNGTWYDAGVEARRRMATAGFDVTVGDIWAVNELSSAVRQGAGNARSNMRDLIRGLYTGEAGSPTVQGVAWTVGFSQSGVDPSTYKANLKSWYGDTAFWDDMSQYVRFWSQEVFGDVRRWAVPGEDLATRRDRVVDYVEHTSVLAQVSPPPAANLKAYMQAADTPLANAAWAFQSGFGYTYVPSTQMQAFVATQTYALRHYQGTASWRDSDAFGFAWSPTNGTVANPYPFGMTQAEYVAQSATILDQLAASIHASDVSNEDDPGVAACGADGSSCAADVEDASFNLAWQSFGTWTQPLASDSTATVTEDTPAEIPLVASDADGDRLTFELLTQPQNGTLSGDGATRTYTPAPNFNGADTFTFRVSDGVMNSRVATETITVTPVNDPPTLELAPAGPVDEGSSTTLTAHATDVEGDAVTFTWKTDVGTVAPAGDASTFSVVDTTATAATATFADDDGPATAHVTVTGDDGNGGTSSATIDVAVLNVAPSAEAGPAATALWGFPVALTGHATDPSSADTSAGFGWSWDFGDGSPTARGAAVTHVYADPGTYTATLRVTDANGGTGVDTTHVTVEYTKTVTGVVHGPFRVAAGQSVLLGPGAEIHGPVTVEAGGSIDVGGAWIAGPLRASGAATIRLCGATVLGTLDAYGGTGRIVVGDGTPACPGSSIAGRVTVQGNAGGVQIVGAVVSGPLRVLDNGGGATVTGNTVDGPLTVTGNGGIVVDTPNDVHGRSTLQ